MSELEERRREVKRHKKIQKRGHVGSENALRVSNGAEEALEVDGGREAVKEKMPSTFSN